MANEEYNVKINDFEQLIGVLTTFDTTLAQSCCQATIGRTETTMFNKWSTGKSDLFTTSIHLDESTPEEVEGSTLFIPNVKKFILVLKNIGKYYDTKDESIFKDGKVKLLVCAKSSYVRIASPKYNIKFQLSTNAVIESQMSNIERVLVPSSMAKLFIRQSTRKTYKRTSL